jgi:hypothetical protein
MDLWMRDDERFVIEALAGFYSATWRAGENPPDAYIDLGGDAVAVEISTLTQYVSDDSGTRERLSDDQPAIRLANELNEELDDSIPNGTIIALNLSSPILRFRRTKPLLAAEIRRLITASDGTNLKRKILGNDIELWKTCHNDPQHKKVMAIISNRPSNRNILDNATFALDGRIKVKTKKCLPLKVRPLWLALLNDYSLACAETYCDAIKSVPVTHPFEKILLVMRDGSVSVLYDCAPIANSLTD